MPRIPILAGIYTDASPSVRVSYPVNMVPVPGEKGVKDGYLRPAEGIVSFATGEGADRGAIFWPPTTAGVLYRVSGTKLITISSSGTKQVLGTVTGSETVKMDYSFDRIGIAADGKLYYWNGLTLTSVVDADIGTVNDMVWIDGYFAVTDGTTIAVTDLNDPTSVNPLKYGSSEVDPDKIQALLKVQNELHAVNRHTIEVFQNIGGDNFPFSRIASAMIPKGAIGRRAACVFLDAVAFVGGGRNEAPSIYLGRNAQTVRISTPEVDQLLLEYTEAQLADVVLESVFDRGGRFLFVHLPDRTLVYDAATSEEVERRVWFVLTSAVAGFSRYRARHIVRAYDMWIVGDPGSTAIGKWSTTNSQHFGSDVRWEFGTLMLRNDGRGAIISMLELVALTGAVPAGEDPMISTSYTLDGRSWSQDRPIKSGKIGDTTKRLVWFQQGMWRNWRVQKFSGDSGSRLSALALEAEIEALSV